MSADFFLKDQILYGPFLFYMSFRKILVYFVFCLGNEFKINIQQRLHKPGTDQTRQTNLSYIWVFVYKN